MSHRTPSDAPDAYERGYREGVEAERAGVVAYLRTRADLCDFIAVAADCIEQSDHAGDDE